MIHNSLKPIQLQWLLFAWGTICLLMFLQLLTTEWLRPAFFTASQIVLYPLIRFSIGVVLIVSLVLPAYDFLIRQRLLIRIIGFAFTGLLWGIAYVCLSIIFIKILSGEMHAEELFIGLMEDFLTNLHHVTTYYLLLVAILLAIDYLKEKTKAIYHKEKAESELSKTKFLMLRNQLQPHFLFNALNSVSAIIDYKKEAAQDMLADISHLLRTSLQLDYTQLVTLQTELDILDTYLNIEKRRFEHQLHIDIKVNAASKKIMVLPFLFQPLVENAIKHGFGPGISQLSINIDVRFEEHQLDIWVANNGIPFSGKQAGVGLTNFLARLQNAYGNQYHFQLHQQGDWTTNHLKISYS